MTPGEDAIDEECLAPFDRDTHLGWLPESGQRRPKSLEPGAIVRHPEREQGPAPALECLDLVMLLAPIDPDEDLH